MYAGLNELMEWCNAGYAEIQKLDREFSDEFAIPPSIKTTSIKPSGTVSLLAGGKKRPKIGPQHV
jgi:ribonucleoside-triphosphate reductase